MSTIMIIESATMEPEEIRAGIERGLALAENRDKRVVVELNREVDPGLRPASTSG